MLNMFKVKTIEFQKLLFVQFITVRYSALRYDIKIQRFNIKDFYFTYISKESTKNYLAAIHVIKRSIDLQSSLDYGQRRLVLNQFLNKKHCDKISLVTQTMLA